MSRVMIRYENLITYHYGNGHTGVDIVGTTNGNNHLVANICSHSDGRVISVRRNYQTVDKTGNSYGNYVVIDHGNGYQTLYAHLQYGSVCVNVGDNVKQGQVIGVMGETGHTYGIHLHFEVKSNGIRINPEPYLDNAFIVSRPTNPTPIPDKDIKKGDIVVVNGVGYADSYGGGANTRKYINHKMKVINVVEGRPYPYACNQYCCDNGVTGWFKDVRK